MTSIGFRAMIDNYKQRMQAEQARQAAADARLLAAEQQRKYAEEVRWRDFNRGQQELLSNLGITATREEGGRVVSNQELLAAIEEQRDRGIASDARLFQLAQSQGIVLRSQPLGSLQVEIRFGGFTDAQFAVLKEGFDQVSIYPETDDEYGRLADARGFYDDSNRYRAVFVPMLEMMMGDSDAPDETDSLILAIDIDGTGAWVLPMGVTLEPGPRGLVFNESWLAAVGNPNDDAQDGLQEIGGCTVPQATFDQRRKEISIEMTLLGNCLPYAIHRAGAANLVARLTDHPTAVIYRNGNKSFPIRGSNVADISAWTSRHCWGAASPSANAKPYIRIVAIPNRRADLTVRSTLHFAGIGDMTYQPTYYDGREDWDAGRCAKFR
ncbi:hypothetical protein P6144_17685 [Sphingomonas sp. HITSZ_GF]|uniref:hypothetical protein n=1 Tax=Sphingomonas sp. HITSZ_GF TaxID=3037247 RepID=UPI00240CF819|nr:hypothetical protein [Sphingomonas sp. HITSZ_GF]MDG2535498.1 hypothetical protein [Sphingomonas sp. HITSZ_GF]